jgi:hypothetical protein
MNQVKFFANPDPKELEAEINRWFSENKSLHILDSNLESVVKPDLLGNMKSIENHVFYVLYYVRAPRKKKAAAEKEELVSVSKDVKIDPEVY